MFEKLQSFSFSNIDKFKTSGIITRLTTDVSNVQNSYQMIALFFVFRYAYPIFRRMFKKIDQMNTVLQENVRGIRVVKSFVREDYETLISEGGKYYQLYTGAFELE